MLIKVKINGCSEWVSYEPSNEDYEDFYGYIPDDKEVCESDTAFEESLKEQYEDKLKKAVKYNVSLNDVLEDNIDYEDYDDTPMNPHCIDARRY